MPTPASLRAWGLAIAGAARHAHLGWGDDRAGFGGLGGVVDGSGLVVGRRRRYVLVANESGDQAGAAVLGDRDDAAGDGHVFRLVGGAGLDLVLDLVEALLDRLGFDRDFLGPLLFVELRHFGLALLQGFRFGGFVGSGLGGDRVDTAEGGEGAPVRLDGGLGPFPGGEEFIGGGLKTFGRGAW